MNEDAVYAGSWVGEAASMVRGLLKQDFTEAEKAEIRAWLPKVRKVISEIEAVCVVKTPTVDDRLNEILEDGEWDRHRWYVVTLAQRHPELGREMPLPMQGHKVKEMLDRDYYLIDNVLAVYAIEDDGTMTRKR